MKKINKKTVFFITIVGLIISSYLTVCRPFGSQNVALHNDGYGTFDMTRYNLDSVKEVLNKSDDINVYYRYYVCDFLFIIFLGLFQFMISYHIFKCRHKLLLNISIGIPIVRGILDAVENIILINTISRYPNLSGCLINTSNYITIIKFVCMGLWFIFVIFGVILKITDRAK